MRDGETSVRQTCSPPYRHWFWPWPATSGQRCICGETVCADDVTIDPELEAAHRREVVEPMERRFLFGDGDKLWRP